MKYILLATVILLPIVVILIKAQQSQSYFPPPLTVEEFEELQSSLRESKVLRTIEKVNREASKTRGIASGTVEAEVLSYGNRFRLTGKLSFQKPNFFRLQLNSALGKELDLGSNKTHFWFWSRKNRPSGIYFARHEDYYKTRLKTPFDPKFFLESLGFSEVTIGLKTKAYEAADRIFLVEKAKNSIDQPIAKFTILDRRKETFSGVMLSNMEGQPIASSELVFDNSYERHYLYIWFEENSSMLVKVKHIVLSPVFPDREWEMPNLSPKIDMSKD